MSCAAATAKSERMGSNAIILLLIDNVVERVKLVVSKCCDGFGR